MPTPGILVILMPKWPLTGGRRGSIQLGEEGPLALLYHNTDFHASDQWMKIYKLRDIRSFVSEGLPSLSGLDRMLVEDGGEVRCYEQIQVFEPTSNPGYPKPKVQANNGQHRPRGMVMVTMEPGESAEDEIDEWYRKQHLDMLSMCRGYRRSTRYKLAPEEYQFSENFQKSPQDQARYLALHEYSSAFDLPEDQIKIVSGTEWSRKVIGNAKIFKRDIWELTEIIGDPAEVML
ncbi:hypothetical protein H2201_006571 [Coniosporium apollinis]|uniref:EthD domain-containing protein n=2 Tax=Coniosporium TaxID=2810619 RepID=A0ABQ9NTC3_9PEZI|nr:hypothetical protein H2199_003806 [Cladosporium sp. JES 115]KAJ9661379.1 hypothetical protein H2201_006571 [Coniosporium apollinis]